MTSNTKIIGRLAPSPTGFLHLGNAWSFLWAWVFVRSKNGRIILRMEDIDKDRSRPEYVLGIEQDLQWLGLHWDGQTIMQSSRNKEHILALEYLDKGGHIYPCYCTRKELRSLAAAPHIDDFGAPYPNICRDLSLDELKAKEGLGRKAALRLRCPQGNGGNIEFVDEIYGAQCFNLQDCGGDFALRRSDGVLAYQLVVVVDDAAEGVNHILRGSDILGSTPRQIFLHNLLGLTVPNYAHVPLLLDAEGERLAKRHKSLTLHTLREQGVRAERIIGLLAYVAGLRDNIEDIHASELLDDFSFERCKNMQGMRQSGIVLKDDWIRALTNS